MFIDDDDDDDDDDDVRRAKLQSNRHHQHTNTQVFTGQMPLLMPNQQCQSTEGKCMNTRNSAVADKPRDAFVQVQRRG